MAVRFWLDYFKSADQRYRDNYDKIDWGKKRDRRTRSDEVHPGDGSEGEGDHQENHT